MKRLILMEWLTPLGTLYYGAHLLWWRWAQANLQRQNPSHPDINLQVRKVRHYQDILAGRMP